MPELHVRPAVPGDAALIVASIRALAAHEGRPEAATVTTADVLDAVFGPRPVIEAVILSRDGRDIGYAMFQEQFATFPGRRRIYLEDVLIDPSERGGGAGGQFMEWLFALARSRGCAAVDWSCVPQNAGAIRFYERLGAERKDGGELRFRYSLEREP